MNRLGQVLVEAGRYIDGERAQATLPLEQVTLVMEPAT
jgi:hypothetical protein